MLLHQTVIGQETIAQMALAEDEPDVVIACVGGGSNFGGLVFPWLRRATQEGLATRFVAAEPAACPTLTKGVYAYDYGDTAGLTPLMPMYTLGHDFVPPPVHAGGLRYHGDSPLVSRLVKEGRVEARAYRQTDAFAAAMTFARTEGIIPAPEPTHALRAVIDEAEAAKEAGEERVILFGLCGHGHFDLAAYDAYLRGELEDPEFDEADARRAHRRAARRRAAAGIVRAHGAHRGADRRGRLPRPQRGDPRRRPQGRQRARARDHRLPLRLGGRARRRGGRADGRVDERDPPARRHDPRDVADEPLQGGRRPPSSVQRDARGARDRRPHPDRRRGHARRRAAARRRGHPGRRRAEDDRQRPRGTDFTFGFQTAVQIATDAIDRLHTTAESHNRVIVVEVMGRDAGWIAAYAGMAGGADVILVPERPFDIEQVCDHVRRRHARGRTFSIVVVSEGAMPAGGDVYGQRRGDRRVRPRAPRRHRRAARGRRSSSAPASSAG